MTNFADTWYVSRLFQGPVAAAQEVAPLASVLVNDRTSWYEVSAGRTERHWALNIVQNRIGESWALMELVVAVMQRQVVGWSIADLVRS